ncbi:putative beta-galactosidase-1-like protein 2, partial [Triplophysa rosa]
ISTVRELLDRSVSINFYMFHGGTSFGFMNGANDFGTYKPQTSSYDYDAPLTESGDYTVKYHLLRNLLSTYNRLVGDITLNDVPLKKFTMYCLEMKPSYINRLESLKWVSVGKKPSYPAFFRGRLVVDEPTDTFVKLPNWSKGVVFVNGRNLGRHWSVGPQKGLYLPGPWLRSGDNQTESKSPRHGGESVAEVLRAHGVKFVFTLVGGHISSILVACEKLGIHIVVTRHETTAVFAADAMARLSGTVGVAAVTAGPGLTNTVTAVKNAQMAESHIADSVGPENIEGYGAVQDLAEFLVSLREHRLALTGEECIKIITLWQALGESDKRKTIYSPNHPKTGTIQGHEEDCGTRCGEHQKVC